MQGIQLLMTFPLSIFVVHIFNLQFNKRHLDWHCDVICNESAASAGLSFLQFCNLNSFRTKFIIGFSLFMGLSVPQYFNEYLLISGHGPVHTSATSVRINWLASCQFLPSPLFVYLYSDYYAKKNLIMMFSVVLQFNNIMQVIFSSPATVAIIVAYLLDCTHSIGHSATRRDSGRHWWSKFRYFDQDTRSEEFYSLPYNLNRFFPSS